MDDQQSVNPSPLSGHLDDQIFHAINQTIDWAHEEEALRSLSPAKRALWITNVLEGDVKNGGFIQYFYNTAGFHIDYLLESFALLDLHCFEEVIRQAIDVFQASRTLYQQAYAQDAATHQLVGFSQLYGEPALVKFRDLDKQFLRLNDGQQLHAARIRLINRYQRELLPEDSTASSA